MAVKRSKPLSKQELEVLDAYWRAANYLTACQLYLLDDPLLEGPLTKEKLKKKIVGHWGTCPGQNFIYTHLNRVIKKYDLDMIYLSGPGHGGNAMVAQDWLDGSYQEVYPNITQDYEGMQKLFKQFSFPGGIPSHVAPETPGSIHEGGELGYSLAHAFGAVLDNPELIAACVVGDGEAETGPLATSWQLNKLLSAKNDGCVLPILHLNGYKIANPTILARIPHKELEEFFRGCGWEPYFVEGSDPEKMHMLMAETLDKCIESILSIQKDAREKGKTERPKWPMIVLRTPNFHQVLSVFVHGHRLLGPHPVLVGAAADRMARNGVRDDVENTHDKKLHGHSPVVQDENGVKDAGKDHAENAEGGDVGRRLHAAERVRHAKHPDHAGKGKEDAEKDQKIRKYPYHDHSFPSR